MSILDFSLVVNHSHFYLVSNIENGVPVFMKRLNGGFAMFFNLKYGRHGSLFGSRYKSIPVKDESQSDAVSRYVSIINPLDVYQPNWREDGLKDAIGAFEFLMSYQFSSFPDKIKKRKSKIIAPAEVSDLYLPAALSPEEYKRFVKDFIGERAFSFQPLFLE